MDENMLGSALLKLMQRFGPKTPPERPAEEPNLAPNFVEHASADYPQLPDLSKAALSEATWQGAPMPDMLKEKLIPQLRLHEGVRDTVYNDSRGIPTIGVGVNMKRGDTRDRLAKLGVDYDAALTGKAKLTPQQIDTLLGQNIDESVKDLKTMFPDFDKMPEKVRLVLSDMHFNLGGQGLRGFGNTLEDIRGGKYDTAADRLTKSLWAKQVKGRATTLIKMLREAAHEGMAGKTMEMADGSVPGAGGVGDGVPTGKFSPKG